MCFIKATVTAVVLTVSLLAAAGPSLAAWPTVTEDRCWEAVGVPSTLLKLRIEPKGSGFYQVFGSLKVEGILENVFTGTVVKHGKKFVMSATDTGSNAGAMWANLTTCTFLGSLAGECEGIGFDRSKVDFSIDTEFFTFSLAPISCP